MDYNKFLNKQVVDIKFSGIRKFFDIAAEMEDVVSLGVGEPDFASPKSAKDAGVDLILNGSTRYTSNAGLLGLRKNITKYLLQRFNIETSDKNVLITVGGSEAIDVAFRAVLNAGDEVLVPEPCFVSYAPCITMAQGVAVGVNCYEKDNFKITPEELERAITPKTKVLLLTYPNNPTGAIMTKADLEKIIPIIIKHNLLIVTDEIYAELTYGSEHCSIASLPNMLERTILISGFSKAFAMTGWRVGYAVAPKEIYTQMLKIHQYIIMCAPSISQVAANAALEEGFKNDFNDILIMRNEYEKRRKYLIKEFNDMGLHCFNAEGAFYVFPCVASLGMTGDEFANKLIQAKKVAVVPGDAFGDCGKFYVRVSYAYSMENLKLAISRIKEFIEESKRK
ncbi:MAG: aminotransferase class I/II-fold pyridoxal phosphate-dependent enzyme [Clostridia bacterium]